MTGAVKIADLGAGPSLRFEQGDENDPLGGGEGAGGKGVAFALRGAARLDSRYFGGSGGFAQGNQAQRQRRRFLAVDPNGTVENACVCGGGESGQQIERLAFSAQPARTTKSAPCSCTRAS